MKVASRTDIGKVRTNNEDSIHIDQGIGIFILADGMGGHNAGEIASRLAVDTVHAFLKDIVVNTDDEGAILDALDVSVMKAHEAIKEKAYSDINLRGMGTTLVVLVIKNEKAYVCHAGDSRAYLFRSTVQRLTKDHTVGDSWVEMGYMTREQVPPQQWHMLTQAVGSGDYPVPDNMTVELKAGDILLLCSDGLTDMLEDVEIAAILKKVSFPLGGNPSEERRWEIADSLVVEANNRGGRDNISLILVAI